MTAPVLSLGCMVLSCLAGFAIPAALFFYFRRKKHADILPFFVGCGVMLVFALIMESAVHRLVLGSSIGDRIRNNVWLYAAYGGLMAGLFEETGRLAAFKTVLRKYHNRDISALMYGAGHGGLEAAFLLGLTMLGNLILSLMVNTGTISLITGSLSGDALTQLNAELEALAATPSWLFLLGILERIFAVAIQLALSVLVWFAVKYRRWYLYPAAILIHFAVDAVAVVLAHFDVPSLALEAVIGLMSALIAVPAARIWRSAQSRPETPPQE